MGDEELEQLNKEEEMELGSDELEDISYLGQIVDEQYVENKPQDDEE